MNGNDSGTGLRAWCRANGVAPSTLHKAVEAGHVARRADGSLDTASADAWAASRGGTPRQHHARSGAPRRGSVASAQRRLISARARLAELELRRRRGELVELEKVKRHVFDSARRARDLLAAVADRAAPIVTGLSDQAEVHRVIGTEMRRAVAELQVALRGCEVGS